MTGWQEIQPHYWRRDVPGGWLGVKPDRGGRWQWVHYVDDFGPSALCYGRDTAEDAMQHADANLQTVVRAARGRARYGNAKV